MKRKPDNDDSSKSGEGPLFSIENNSNPLMALKGGVGHRFDASKYSPEKALELLDDLRRALPFEGITAISDKIYDLPQELRDPSNKLFDCLYVGSRIYSVSNWKLLDEAAKALVERLDLEAVFDVKSPDIFGRTPYIASLDALFLFLRDVSESLREVNFKIVTESLKSLFESVCKTDDERKKLLQHVLKDIGFSNLMDETKSNVRPVETSLPVEETVLPLPTKAPASWRNHEERESLNVIEFTEKNYRDWLGKGLTQEHIKRLDPHLYNALGAYKYRHKSLPFDLPTRREIIDRKAEKFDPDTLREAARIANAQTARKYREP